MLSLSVDASEVVARPSWNQIIGCDTYTRSVQDVKELSADDGRILERTMRRMAAVKAGDGGVMVVIVGV